MKYTCIQVQPKDFDSKINSLANKGWTVVSQSESTWVIKKCFGFSSTRDSIINVTLCKE